MKFTHEQDAEIFAVGTWNGYPFTVEDLEAIAANFEALKEVRKVPLKLGHDEDQPLTDGMPALGWVDKVWVEGEKLLAHFIDLPDVVGDAIASRAYRTVSVELDMDARHKGQDYKYVLSGVALLGATLPAVNNLADLTEYLSQTGPAGGRRMVFTAINHKPLEGDVKTNKPEADAGKLLDRLFAIKELPLGKLAHAAGITGKKPAEQIRLALSNGQTDALMRVLRGIREWIIAEQGMEKADEVLPNWEIEALDYNEEFSAKTNNNEGDIEMSEEALKAQLAESQRKLEEEQAKTTEFARKESERVEAEKKQAIVAKRAEVEAALEEGVKAGSIIPAQREAFSKAIGLADDARVETIDVEEVKTFANAGGKRKPGGEQGLSEDRGGQDYDATRDASDELAEKANALMAEKDISYSKASQLVMRANPQLAREYRGYTANISDGRA